VATRTRWKLTAAIGAALLLWLTGTARAQNLVVNGDFATDVSGWSTAYHGAAISTAWSDLDPADPTPSGSIQVTSTITGGGSAGPTQCVDLLVAEPELRMDVLVPSQPAFDYVTAYPYVRWYSEAGCTIGEISTEFVLGAVPAGLGWTRLAGPLIPPGSAQAVLIDLGIVKPSGSSDPAVAYFDNLYLPEPGADSLGMAVFAILAALASRRTRTASSRPV
jgi:hypothetical protein